ncbi:hypothetical protein IGI04_042808 [Brassica rapa subsp. trilocularis]|uniref:Uncharacterized protein n=1 Tax=Brassica rapa subsp. trilocularis TaxID=1813537 RepID=A0ABQ7KJ00_BRACM|nr:hypothetical protein IGI04_042808 [Brassica rapa subsp. trilocularis]
MGSVVLDSDRPVTCTLNGSPLPLGDSKHPSCLLLFYISHSYALHSKLGLSCTDRLVLQDSELLVSIPTSPSPMDLSLELSMSKTPPFFMLSSPHQYQLKAITFLLGQWIRPSLDIALKLG